MTRCHGHDVFPDHVCTDLCTDNLCCVTLGTVTPPAVCDYWYDADNRCNAPTPGPRYCADHACVHCFDDGTPVYPHDEHETLAAYRARQEAALIREALAIYKETS